MAKARGVLLLQLAVGLSGLAVVFVTAAAANGRVSWQMPSTEQLLEACQNFILPAAGATGIAALVFGVLAVAVVGLGLRSLMRQLRATRRFMRSLAPPRVTSIAGSQVTVVEDVRPLAFCAGLLRPRIFLSRATVEALDESELSVVVAHEACHANQRDPLRVLVTRVLADALFFLPAARRLGRRYEELVEIAADQFAVRPGSRRRAALASALLSLEATGSAVVGIAPERVDHLMGDRTRWDLPVALLVAAFVVLMVMTTIALRLEAAAATELNLPLLAAQACMLVMAVVPLMFGAFLLMRARR